MQKRSKTGAGEGLGTRLACAVDASWIMESMQTAASGVSFSLGERFRSFGELEDKLKRYEESTFTKFWKRDCRTVEAARRRMARQTAS